MWQPGKGLQEVLEKGKKMKWSGRNRHPICINTHSPTRARSGRSILRCTLYVFLDRVVFSFGLSEISQYRGFNIIIVSSTFPFAVGYFLTQFFPCCLWLGFSQFKRKISQIHILTYPENVLTAI